MTPRQAILTALANGHWHPATRLDRVLRQWTSPHWLPPRMAAEGALERRETPGGVEYRLRAAQAELPLPMDNTS